MNPLSSITLRSDLKWSERCGVNEWEKEIAAVPYGDEGEAQEEAQCAANTGNQGGEGEDQLLLLHEGVVRSRPELEQEVLASPRQELLLTHLDVECEDGVVKYKPIDILDNDKAFDSQSGSQSKIIALYGVSQTRPHIACNSQLWEMLVQMNPSSTSPELNQTN